MRGRSVAGIVLCLSWGATEAQIELGGFGGLGWPAQPHERSYRTPLYVPVGIQGGYILDDVIFMGGELEYGGLTLQKDEYLTQTFYGGILRLRCAGDPREYHVYGRLGGGKYSGRELFRVAEPTLDGAAIQVITREIEYSAWGFNLGGGIAHRMPSCVEVFGELVYHAVVYRVEREYNEDCESRVGPDGGLVVRGGARYAF